MEQVREPENADIIAGPLSIGLSPDGVENFLQKGQKVRKIRFFDGGEEFGLELPSITARSLQKMAMTGMVTRVERSVSDFSKQRKHIMNLTSSFAIATVYRQFETRLWEIIGKSDLLISWNRANPRLNIGPGVNLAAQAFQMLIAKTKDGILAYKQEVLKSVQANIARIAKASNDEKKDLTLLAIRYLNAIDPVVWLLLVTSKDVQTAAALVSELQKLLIQYVGRSELPEYLALMLVELVVVVGNVQGDGESVKNTDGPQTVYVSYVLGSLRKSQEERTKMTIQIGNEASEFSSLRTRVDQQANANLKHRSLDAFFAGVKGNTAGGAPISGDSGTNELGMYYLSYLKEACHKMDISLDSFVNAIPHTKRTLINLVLAI